MNITQIARNTIAAAALITLGLSTNAVAETQTVTRGPNGAASIVKKVPLDAQQQPKTEPHDALSVVNRGPNGAPHITKTEATNRSAATPTGNIITRGPNGAAFIAN
ncbi:hypothetical protein [Acaryochloris sp. CCMEE 5410]|uniref:hypothetical protein n=1 Tax=Acaryochloris sp. CCMEE 5410 TaxID=310037 RepID=UPI0002483FE3|nr:hypothetical protein [Acaryochloris sp. CCMEE 5410]KAI9133604.1 hypothetical protein ON05_010025 [Acaryochloris sp. CCMEE 5410]